MWRAARGFHPLDVARRRLWLGDTPGNPGCRGRPSGFILQRSLKLLLLLRRERRRDAAAPLTIEIGGVLFVDMPLLFGRRIGTAISKLRFCMKSK